MGMKGAPRRLLRRIRHVLRTVPLDRWTLDCWIVGSLDRWIVWTVGSLTSLHRSRIIGECLTNRKSLSTSRPPLRSCRTASSISMLTPDVQSGCRVFYWVNLVKSQDPSSKSQCTPNSQLPTRELILAVWLGFWDLGVRWSLELGSWDLTRAAQSSCAVSLSTRERNLVQHHS
jgi:hypothetical protein